MSNQTTDESKTSSLLGDYDDELIEAHEYDGIQEYDNPMPGWWKWLFIVTIIWSVVYVAGISLGYINTYEEDLAAGQEEIIALRDQNQSAQPEVNAELLAAAAGDEQHLSDGEAVYQQNCASCHGQNGEGMIGPNLTDDYWLHGGSNMDVYRTIADGASANGMPPWEGVISAEELISVTAYVDSLRGTEPDNAKEPQGDEYAGGGS